jgi:hypothetical protein
VKILIVSKLSRSGFITHFSRFYAQQLQGVTIPQLGYETGSRHFVANLPFPLFSKEGDSSLLKREAMRDFTMISSIQFQDR